MWYFIIIVAIVVIVMLKFKSESTKSNAAQERLKSIDPNMSPIVNGSHLGWALGVSQTNQSVYIRKFYTNNTEEIVEIPFSKLFGVEIEPVELQCNLIIYYISGEVRFYILKDKADQIRKTLIPIIEQNVQCRNSAITKAAGKNAKIIEVTVIGESQLSDTPYRAKAYVNNNVLRLEEMATHDNPNFQGFSARISLSSIVAFEQIGDVHYTTDVSGGGSSLTGAIIGGVIAGGAGAIIGSRQAVTSSTREIDDRATVLKYRAGGQICQILFMHDDYYLLSDLIE